MNHPLYLPPNLAGIFFLYCVEFESKVWFSKPRKAAALWRCITNATVSVGGTAGIVHVYKQLFGAQQQVELDIVESYWV